jgi:hypothetical protein
MYEVKTGIVKTVKIELLDPFGQPMATMTTVMEEASLHNLTDDRVPVAGPDERALWSVKVSIIN